MGKRVLVFDLDDTLYDETTFVKSGFKNVAAYLSKAFPVSEKKIYNNFIHVWEKEGRGKIFDTVLNKNGIYSKGLVKKCLSIYRLHLPTVKLWPHADRCLKRFKSYPLYIVTDGNKVAQFNKIKGLKLEKRVKKYLITHRFGVKNAKPSPYCFNLICAKEKVNPNNVVYFADNVSKDFVGIKPLGFKTVQVNTGQYLEIKRSKEFHAEYKVNDLSEVTEEFLEKIFKK
jgi:putative hydrolase of the HAD superfamily